MSYCQLEINMSDAVKIVTRTIYSAQMQTNLTLKIPHQIVEFSTLNEAINLSDIVPFQPVPATAGMQMAESYNPETDSARLGIQYWCIGNGGHTLITSGTKAIPVPAEKPHKASDACLYDIIPFVLKPVDQDLTKEQRANYRLRKILKIDDEFYVAYFLRKLPVKEVAPKLLQTKVQNGISTTTEFIPTVNNLNPTDPVIGQENDGSYLSVSSTINVDFNEQDVAWLKEACTILYGDSALAVISEIAICSGVDKPITQEYPISGTQTSNNVATQGYMEAIGVQAHCFINYFFSGIHSNQGFSFDFDIGAAEPLFSTGR